MVGNHSIDKYTGFCYNNDEFLACVCVFNFISVFVGKGYDFHVTFRPANNFPVDLYFLFDLSSTMKEYIKDFAQLTRDIGNACCILLRATLTSHRIHKTPITKQQYS